MTGRTPLSEHLIRLNQIRPLDQRTTTTPRQRPALFWGMGRDATSGDLLAGEIGDVHEGVVEGGEDVADSKDVLAFGDLRSQADHLLFLLFFTLAWCHCWRKKHTHSYKPIQSQYRSY